jgi:hypothetical protein
LRTGQVEIDYRWSTFVNIDTNIVAGTSLGPFCPAVTLGLNIAALARPDLYIEFSPLLDKYGYEMRRDYLKKESFLV